MISPDTAPGTEVVCINSAPGRYGPSGLVKGAIYTIKRIAPALDGAFAAFLEEVKPGEHFDIVRGRMVLGYSLSRFRYLELPRELTELLDRAPVKELA